MSTSPKRIAVTGGSGRIGQATIRLLMELGYDVISLDRRSCPGSPARFYYIDLRHREMLQMILEKVDIVIHLGEIPTSVHDSPDVVFAHNTAVASSVMQTAADLKLQRVIYTSTAQVYGSWGEEAIPPAAFPVTEDHPLRARNAYALSKICNEAFARLTGETTGLRISMFRMPWVTDAKAGGRMLRWLRTEDDDPRRDMRTYVHVDDVARAFVKAIEADLDGVRVYNLSADDILSRTPLAEMLRRVEGYPSLPSDWPAFKSPLVTDRAKAELGWAPQISLREALLGDSAAGSSK